MLMEQFQPVLDFCMNIHGTQLILNKLNRGKGENVLPLLLPTTLLIPYHFPDEFL